VPTKIPKTRTRPGRQRDCVARILCPKRDPIAPSLATYERIDELARLTPTVHPLEECDGEQRRDHRGQTYECYENITSTLWRWTR
jgi:hypothetical protein